MKSTVCSLFAALFIVTAIASCDTATGPDNSFDLFTVGSWTVTSETTANWTGQEAKNVKSKTMHEQGDTLVFNTPSDIGVEIEAWGDRPGEDSTRFNWIITDSLMTDSIRSAHDFSTTFEKRNISGDINFSTDLIIFGNDNPDDPESPWRLSSDGEVTCSDNLQSSENAAFLITRWSNSGEEKTPFRTYKINVDGFTEVIDILVCKN